MPLKKPHIGRRTIDPLPFGPGLNAHRMVAETAIKIANEMFEDFMKDNGYYRNMRAGGQLTERQARIAFVARVAPRFLEDARQALAGMLAEPDDRVTPHMKTQIHEALVADNVLRAKRLVAESAATVPGTIH